MTAELNVDALLRALDNDSNAHAVTLNYAVMAKEKNDMLQRLHLPPAELKLMHQKLRVYRLVDTMAALGYGRYVRWFNLSKPGSGPLRLTNGGIICDIKVLNNEIYVTCKNKLRQLFTLILSHVVLFQRLTDQEQLIVKAMSLLDED